MGVIFALLEGTPLGLAVWLGVIILVFLLVGFLAAKIMPGELPTFYMEIPPLRLPQLSNVLRKTWSRLSWYFKEILPLFIFASLLIWLGQITGVFNIFVKILEHPIRAPRPAGSGGSGLFVRFLPPGLRGRRAV